MILKQLISYYGIKSPGYCAKLLGKVHVKIKLTVFFLMIATPPWTILSQAPHISCGGKDCGLCGCSGFPALENKSKN